MMLTAKQKQEGSQVFQPTSYIFFFCGYNNEDTLHIFVIPQGVKIDLPISLFRLTGMMDEV